MARHHLTPISGRYKQLGEHYLRDLPYRFSGFNKHVAMLLRKARVKNEKVRWLDIGPGMAGFFMPYFEAIDPKGKIS